MRLFCRIGAGAVQSYSHAENTGLVISDAAKIGSFSVTSKFLSKKFQKEDCSHAKKIRTQEAFGLSDFWTFGLFPEI